MLIFVDVRNFNDYKILVVPVLLIILLIGSGCSSTKFVPENKYLLKDNSIIIDKKNLNKEELTAQIKQKENIRILGLFKFHLFMYNLKSKEKEQGLFGRIGEAPVIYDDLLRFKSEQQLRQYLDNKGYYNSNVVSDTIVAGKKIKVQYKIQVSEPYYIRNIKYTVHDENLKTIITSKNDVSLLKKGDLLDVDVMAKERLRIARMLNNEGFYYFLEDYIHYSVDSNLFRHVADVEIVIEKAKATSVSGSEAMHKKYWIDRFHVYIDNYSKTADQTKSKTYLDTLAVDGITFYYNDKMLLKESLIRKSIDIAPGSYYNKANEERTYNNLYGLRQFKYVNIQYEEIQDKGDSLNGYLIGKIYLPMQTKQNYSFDIEGTNTSGNLGIAGNLNYQHRNLSSGGQILELNFRGANERQTSGQVADFNMRELGTEAKILFPGFVFPFGEQFKFYTKPQTQFSVAYNFQERPEYSRRLAYATFGYQWKSDSKRSHTLNPIEFNVVRIPRIESWFLDSIQDLYIKSGYTDHVISSTNYSIVFRDQDRMKGKSSHYLKLSFEAAGNTWWAFSRLTNRPLYSNNDPDPRFITSYYQAFNTRFAQYLKGDGDLRFGYRLDKVNSLAFRTFVGIAFPYGNFNVMPFEKRYFTGGANGIRAWQVRSLGPGTYSAGTNSYPNQSADVKLEANFEYRFQLIWLFEGAFFVDAGNIWAINNTDNREGAVFYFNKFYQQFAVGSGLGLRFVYPYFIIRADLGIKLRDPSLEVGRRWIPIERTFNSSDFNFNIAIGYPF